MTIFGLGNNSFISRKFCEINVVTDYYAFEPIICYIVPDIILGNVHGILGYAFLKENGLDPMSALINKFKPKPYYKTTQNIQIKS